MRCCRCSEAGLRRNGGRKTAFGRVGPSARLFMARLKACPSGLEWRLLEPCSSESLAWRLLAHVNACPSRSSAPARRFRQRILKVCLRLRPGGYDTP